MNSKKEARVAGFSLGKQHTQSTKSSTNISDFKKQISYLKMKMYCQAVLNNCQSKRKGFLSKMTFV